MKKYITFIITLNILLWFGLSNIAKAHHKPTIQQYKEYRYKSVGSDDYKKLETNLVENKLTAFVDKQLKNNDKTGLVNYVVWENGKILVDKSNYTDEIIKIDYMMRSNSMGKSIAAYVVGHGVCKGYINNINQSVADWAILNNTLYADNTLLELMNMTAGDHNFIGEYKYNQFKQSSDGAVYGKGQNVVQKISIAQNMNKFFRNTTKKKGQYNYSALTTHVFLNYLISKFDSAEEYEKFLTEIFRDHVGVKDEVSFQKTSWSSADFNEGNSRFTFFARSHDYLRIGIQMIEDYNSDTCIGQYMRDLYDNRVKKGHDGYSAHQSGAYTKAYGGQFHMNFIGMKKRVIFAMDGMGGQQLVMDMENNRVVLVNSVDQHYDWKKIVYNVMKKGL
tara:strand:- start:4047 stop:5216 length:1170 start_codon:yes stop_codon:yes gene_type:complete